MPYHASSQPEDLEVRLAPTIDLSLTTSGSWFAKISREPERAVMADIARWVANEEPPNKVGSSGGSTSRFETSRRVL